MHKMLPLNVVLLGGAVNGTSLPDPCSGVNFWGGRNASHILS